MIIGGTFLGALFLFTFLISIVAILQRNAVTTGLVVLNWTLLLNGISILVIGTYIWEFTLHERNNYHAIFGQQSDATKIAIQDMVTSSSLSSYRRADVLFSLWLVAVLWVL